MSRREIIAWVGDALAAASIFAATAVLFIVLG